MVPLLALFVRNVTQEKNTTVFFIISQVFYSTDRKKLKKKKSPKGTKSFPPVILVFQLHIHLLIVYRRKSRESRNVSKKLQFLTSFLLKNDKFPAKNKELSPA